MPSFARLLRSCVRTAPALALALGFVALAPSASLAQATWDVQLEVGGSFNFGNSPQSQLATRAEIAGTGPTLVSTTKLEYNYGVSEDNDGNVTINRRSWVVTQAVDYVAGERWRPFVTGKTEAALERRIDLRVDAGAGAKYDVQSSETTRTEFSVALLGEKTWRRIGPGESEELDGLARWSSAFRWRCAFMDGRMSVDLQQNYRPAFSDFGDFTFTSLNATSFGLNESAQLRFSLKLEHDSEAKTRGAITNTDTQVQVSIVMDL